VKHVLLTVQIVTRNSTCGGRKISAATKPSLSRRTAVVSFAFICPSKLLSF